MFIYSPSQKASSQSVSPGAALCIGYRSPLFIPFLFLITVSAEIPSSCVQKSASKQLGEIAKNCNCNLQQCLVWCGADTCGATRHRPGDSILYCEILPYKSINTQTVNTKQFEKGDQTNKRGISATVAAAPRMFCEGSWEYHISNNFVRVPKTHSDPAGSASGADSTFNGQFK